VRHYAYYFLFITMSRINFRVFGGAFKNVVVAITSLSIIFGAAPTAFIPVASAVTTTSISGFPEDFESAANNIVGWDEEGADNGA